MTCFKKLNKNTVAILNSSSNSWNSSQTIGLARKMSNRGLIVDNTMCKEISKREIQLGRLCIGEKVE